MKSLKYATESLSKARDKVKCLERDILLYNTSITKIETQIEIKEFNLVDVKNKLEDKILNDSVDDIFNVSIKKEKL